MSENAVARARELLKRAGLGEVPPVVLLGVCLVAVAVIGTAIWRWAPAGSESFEFEAGATGAAALEEAMSPPRDAAVESAEATSVVVHVVGAVRNPGVVSLPAGSRVADAVDAAGGLLSNAAPQALNLARIISDGEQVAVLTLDEWETSGGSATGAVANAAAAPGGTGTGGVALVDLNSASAQELETLSGIGPSTSAKIVADREANGPFTSPEDLMRVSGIGPKKFEALKDAIVVR